MKQASLIALVVACVALPLPRAALAGDGADAGRGAQIEKPAADPVEREEGYRPRWADPYAKPPQPGIENDPTPFDPSDVDANSDTLNNNLNNMDQ
jgi:hypothetical protein